MEIPNPVFHLPIADVSKAIDRCCYGSFVECLESIRLWGPRNFSKSSRRHRSR